MSVSQPGTTPPVPEPFWHSSWRSLWRWKPACIECGERLFRDRAAYDAHYLRGIHFNPKGAA